VATREKQILKLVGPKPQRLRCKIQNRDAPRPRTGDEARQPSVISYAPIGRQRDRNEPASAGFGERIQSSEQVNTDLLTIAMDPPNDGKISPPPTSDPVEYRIGEETVLQRTTQGLKRAGTRRSWALWNGDIA
jgi:hypothetical protein